MARHSRPAIATTLSMLLSCLLMMVSSLAPASDAAASPSAAVVQIDDTTAYVDLGLALSYLEDPTGELGIDDVRGTAAKAVSMAVGCGWNSPRP